MRRRWYRFSTPSIPRRRNIAAIVARMPGRSPATSSNIAPGDTIRPPRVHQARLREPNQHVSYNIRVQTHFASQKPVKVTSVQPEVFRQDRQLLRATAVCTAPSRPPLGASQHPAGHHANPGQPREGDRLREVGAQAPPRCLGQQSPTIPTRSSCRTSFRPVLAAHSRVRLER